MSALGTLSFTTAETNTIAAPVVGLGKINGISLVAVATITGGGTTAKVYVQTSLDGGVTWFDIAQFAFTTSSAVKGKSVDGKAQVTTASLTTGTMTDDGIQHGIIGDQLRMVMTTTGTYSAGSQVAVFYQTR